MNKLMTAGTLMVAVGIALLAFGASGQGGGSAGGFVLIGPIPIVFATGSYGEELAILSVLAGILIIIVLFMALSRFRTLSREGKEESVE